MALISLDIHVDRLDDVLAIFDRIEVYRSIVGSGGPYEEITDENGPLPALIDGTVEGPFVLNTLPLVVSVDGGVVQTVTFTGTDPLDLETVLIQINAVIPGLASEKPTATDKLRLTSPTTGTGSSLTVTAGAAATALGLSTDKDNGEAARVPIVDPTSDYNFKDLDGLESFFYKIRYSSTFTNTVSSFSPPRQGSLDTVLDLAHLSKAMMYLTTGEGKPVVARCIRFVPMAVKNPASTNYFLVPGVDARVSAVTNELGYAEIYLLRGATYRVFFEGTDYGREFIVPDLADFNLLELIGTSPDPFDIVRVPSRPIKVS
jgi:hypothetical protein